MLIKQDSIAGQTVDTQAALVQQLVGTVALDRANEDAARLNLQWSRIVAPVTGRVGLRPIDAGNFIAAGSSITTGQPLAVIRWNAAVHALQTGHLPCSGSEQAILKIASSLAEPGIAHTIVVFGSARAPSPEAMAQLEAAPQGGEDGPRLARLRVHAGHYQAAREFGRIASQRGGAFAPRHRWRDNVIATAQSGIPADVESGKIVSGYPAIDNVQWLKCSVVFNKLPELYSEVRKSRKTHEKQNQ